jgi:acyl carrier protein
MDAITLSRDSVITGIHTGFRHAKRDSTLVERNLTASTHLWPTGDPSQPSLALDSLDFLELVVFLEEQFGWLIPESQLDASECSTVGDLVALIIGSADQES